MGKQQIGSAAIMREENTRWISGRRFRVLLCASGMCFMIMLDSNIVAVSLPSIARDLGAAFSDIEWVVSAYVLTFAALLIPSGALADRIGRRRIALVCQSASKKGSDAILVQMIPTSSWRSKQPGTQQVQLGTAIHLPLHQLQLGILPLGLTVGPWMRQRRQHRVFVGGDAVRE